MMGRPYYTGFTVAVFVLLQAPGVTPVPPLGSAAGAGLWSHAHGDAGNTGFADVVTAPAGFPARKVTGLGD